MITPISNFNPCISANRNNKLQNNQIQNNRVQLSKSKANTSFGDRVGIILDKGGYGYDLCRELNNMAKRWFDSSLRAGQECITDRISGDMEKLGRINPKMKEAIENHKDVYIFITSPNHNRSWYDVEGVPVLDFSGKDYSRSTLRVHDYTENDYINFGKHCSFVEEIYAKLVAFFPHPHNRDPATQFNVPPDYCRIITGR